MESRRQQCHRWANPLASRTQGVVQQRIQVRNVGLAQLVQLLFDLGQLVDHRSVDRYGLQVQPGLHGGSLWNRWSGRDAQLAGFLLSHGVVQLGVQVRWVPQGAAGLDGADQRVKVPGLVGHFPVESQEPVQLLAGEGKIRREHDLQAGSAPVWSWPASGRRARGLP